jgi:hypothetical protein
MEEAVEWVKRCPNPMPGSEAEIEIRPLYEADDFAAADQRASSGRRSASSARRSSLAQAERGHDPRVSA